MRNRALHDALREFALDAAALLSEDQRAGSELQFDLEAGNTRRGPKLYQYRPLTEAFIGERWERLRTLPSCAPAAEALDEGAISYLRVQGLRGAEAEPALRAMLERLYEGATSFDFPEERFERVYQEVERVLYVVSQPATVLVPVHGLELEPERVELHDGLVLGRGERTDAPEEAVWSSPGCADGETGEEPNALCVLERDVSPDDPLPVVEARAAFRELLAGLRLFKPGGVALGTVGWRRAGDGRWAPFELEGTGAARGEPWILVEGEDAELREFLAAVGRFTPTSTVAWALSRFDMGCSRALEAEALSDYLLGLRALLDASADGGRSSLSLRLAALCAEGEERRTVQRRVELALALERFVVDGGPDDDYLQAVGPESPRMLVDEAERHLRALLRDVLCGYLEPDLKGMADGILLEQPDRPASAPATATGRRVDAVTDEIDAVAAGEVQAARLGAPEATTASVEYEGAGPPVDWDDPESWSAPV